MLFAIAPVWAGTLYTVGMTETSTSQGTHLISIDTDSGVGSVVGAFGSGYDDATAVTFSPSGVLYTVIRVKGSAYQLATANLATGAATPLGVTVFPTMTMTFAPDGTLYRADMSGAFFQTDIANGVSTLIGNLGFEDIMDLAFDSHGTLYGVASAPAGTGTSDIYRINPANAQSTLVATLSTPCIMSLAFDAADVLYGARFCSANSELYRIDLIGQSTDTIGATGIRSVHGGDMLPVTAAVPEPGSWLTMAGGFGLFCALQCLRRGRVK
jgi:hypothetical protein